MMMMMMMGSLIQLSNITSGLTSDCITCSFTSLEALRADARDIFDKLERDDANQIILIYNLPEPIRKRLDDEDKTVLDAIPFRLMFEGNIALIKIITNHYHINITSRLRDTISFASLDAGASRDDSSNASTWSSEPGNPAPVHRTKGHYYSGCCHRNTLSSFSGFIWSTSWTDGA